MNLEYVDTQSLATMANDINTLNNEYIAEINALFKRLSEIPYTTNEWVGNEAQRYIKMVLLEKNDFLELSTMLKNFTTLLTESSYQIDNTINKNNTLERDI